MPVWREGEELKAGGYQGAPLLSVWFEGVQLWPSGVTGTDTRQLATANNGLQASQQLCMRWRGIQ